MKELIKNILVRNQERDFSKGLMARGTDLTLGLDKIQAIIGPRRVGKTSILSLAIDQLRKKSTILPHQLVYFNFEDERLSFADPAQLDLLLQAWQELHPKASLAEAHFFFDEVQAAKGWEKFINRINESYTKRIYFTGSNSAVLHTNIQSVMRGRSIAIELLPLSFGEYCTFKGVKPSLYGDGKSLTLVTFQQYLEMGGYPETVRLPNRNVHTAYLQEYYRAMLLRDIVEYNQLSNYSYLRQLYRMAASSIGKTISVRRLYNQLRANQFQVGVNAVYDAMQMAENAYLFKRIGRFDYSDSKSEKSDKKIYWLDNGLLNANHAQHTENKGLLLENLVFQALYKRYGTIYDTNVYYYNEPNHECDFVVKTKEGEQLPIQVCRSLQLPETKKREMKGLIKACHYSNAKEGWILTEEEEEELETEGIKVFVKPVWKWLLTE